jgi:CubicO group peptidase (beta-lactamase class C family)
VRQNLLLQIFQPGTVPAYSNYNADLAVYIVQRISEISFERYIDEHIFQPLGMNHSSFAQPLPAYLLPLVSKGYVLASQPAKDFSEELVVWVAVDNCQ